MTIVTRVITVDWNKSDDTTPKSLKKWLILSFELNYANMVSYTRVYPLLKLPL
ncbi:hypothetical protein HanXRQr2_Chr04g0170331 [Helianthus annuus]|uniref:Uncharacterized protein n=1 Tax=Helianthus annuus TaxID=4232 RepID=A0A251UZI8_HELAN|nr:hypothetical protein HanXRQr2_Chr04g0170331 [Helianthus annuus]KAJ0931616.1 hypothetical protein HanPSC8_Chr04g0163871 [Helianthus annuus]